MLSSREFVLLYGKVLLNELKNDPIALYSFQSATKNLKDTYRSNPSVWNEETSRNADYNDAAHRCAYLHKYAPIHSCMVQDMLCRAFEEGSAIFKKTLSDNMPCLNICSLGGGPGVDAIGVVSALHKEFGLQHYSVQVVDCMVGWKTSFDSALEELRDGYGDLFRNFSPDYLKHSFIIANLLEEMNSSVIAAIQAANLITMIKFLSGATCKNTELMVRRIFNAMKHGAFLLFIDNAAGGFSELVSRLGDECKLIPVFGPLDQERYSNEEFGVRRCGIKSCFDIRITVHLLMKCDLQLTETQIITHTPNLHVENETLPQKSLTEMLNQIKPKDNKDDHNCSVIVDNYEYFDEQFELDDEECFNCDCCNSFQNCDCDMEDYECYDQDEESCSLDVASVSCNRYFGSVTIMDLSALF